ncbi:tRNA uridine-5-carboxymethylaminomethyl(34) synthesis GTPase MnmE [Hoeflea sp. WL0058]|uniref:tRNA modification GTPase MnmE n=1 Tax=Flavimaribacter sediminis TaxID=2865987 RepID=A0AAE2ZPA1_9HYPH|nr:tRNA uridine-5-carboxymethylaminomethyl(34) synthesis GTPase MnmE [Flavimaribacter sediminis]MBW8638350.1 tRNA uridine-5-carboxymethylaminomethyl(34) synthesis GTPase MnmE [Flavimaribacter sediminis]
MTAPDYRDTIFALSSGPPPSGVAVIRISGPDVRFALETMTGAAPDARRAVLANICDRSGKIIDRGLIIYFPGPHSFTGEDCAEFQIHGGMAVISSMLAALSALPGLRSAEPGEFSRRAFDNGKMDLTAVEGLADLIAAETEAQRKMALEQSTGSLLEIYRRWRNELIRIRAMIEADFDFSDEEDVPGSVVQSIWTNVSALRDEIGRHLEDARAGEIIRSGYRVAIVGAPNAGKSSLLNALTKRDVAIVSDEAGTTRDVLEVRLDLNGYSVILFDTAGIREGAGAVEEEGIRRAKATAASADLVLELREPGAEKQLVDIEPDRHLLVASKSDLGNGGAAYGYDCEVSVRTDHGLDALINLLAVRVSSSTASTSPLLPNRQRHREYLQRCLYALDEALIYLETPLEMRAELLRNAGDMIGRLTGAIDTEDLLDVIFSEFCIGK